MRSKCRITGIKEEQRKIMRTETNERKKIRNGVNKRMI